METAPLLATLPLEQRLALAYSPRSSRNAMLALLALDNRLARVVRDGREPMLIQLRLAWWRDRFATDAEGWPEGEPLLQLLRTAALPIAAASALVDGWEALVGESGVNSAARSDLIEARVSAFEALASTLGVRSPAVARAARTWAEMDCAGRFAIQRQKATGPKPSVPRLPRALRTLGVLASLAMRAARRDSGGMIEGPVDLLVALRVGISGI